MAEETKAPVATESTKPPKKQRIYSKKNIMMAAGQITGSLYVSSLVGPFMTLVVVTFAGLDAAVYGQIQAVNAVIGFIMVFVTGILFQKVHLPWGKARSWQYVGSLIGCIATALAFSQIPISDGTGKIVFYWLVLIIGQELYGIAASGTYALFPMMTPDPTDRINAGAVMAQVGQVFSVVWRSCMLPLIALLGMLAGNKEAGYSIYAWIVLILVIVCYFVMAHAGKPYDPSDKALKAGVKPLGAYVDQAAERNVSFFAMVRALFSRQPLSFILSKFTRDMALMTINATIAYNFTFVYPSPVIMGLYFAINALGGLVGAFVSPLLANRTSMKFTYIVAEALMIVFSVLGFFLGTNAIASFVFLVLTMFSYYMCSALEKPMFSNAADYTVLKQRKPVRPFLMTCMTLPGKVSGSLAPAILGFVLAAIAFNKANVTPEAAAGLHMVITLLPALYVAISIVCILFYTVNKQNLDKLREENEAAMLQK